MPNDIVAGAHSPLARVDIDSIIDRIANGEYQSHIARELGVAPQSLHERITKHPGYRVALKLRNQAKLDDAQSDIAVSPDLARAREAFKAASWRAERECPDEWGAKTQVSGDLNVHVHVHRGLTLEGEKPLEISEASESGSCVIVQE